MEGSGKDSRHFSVSTDKPRGDASSSPCFTAWNEDLPPRTALERRKMTRTSTKVALITGGGISIHA